VKGSKVVFACQECGAQSPKWLGRCQECGAWNSFVEEATAPVGPKTSSAPAFGGGVARRYSDVEIAVTARLSTGIDEFDRVLGGGLVPGSLVLLGGEPGIGK
jgi:DNA repair protein RadA/Sms